MGVQTLLEERARQLAEAHGHQLSGLYPNQGGTALIGVCARCSALAIVDVRQTTAGIRGTACMADCAMRRRLRLLPDTPYQTLGSGELGLTD